MRNLTKPTVISILVLFALLFVCDVSYSQDERRLYSLARDAARANNMNSAFMYYYTLLNSYPETKYRQEALFAVGEYYYYLLNYRGSVKAFMELIDNYPGYEAKPFALAYLLKIAESKKQDSVAKSLEKDILNCKRLILVFKDSTEYEFKSPLNKKYRIVYFIDKVQIFIDRELFATISY